MNEIVEKKKKILYTLLLLILAVLIVVCIILFALSDREAPVITINAEYLSACDLNDEEAVLMAASAVDNITDEVEIIVADIINLNGNTFKIYFAAKDEAGNSVIDSVVIENDTILENNVYIKKDQTEKNDISEQQTEAIEEATEPLTETAAASPEAPVVKLTTDLVYMNIGDAFNYMDYIESITDDKDETAELYKRIRVDGFYNANHVGDYEISYFVTDSDGNKSDVAKIMFKVRNYNQQ